jgi:hypothetical protein
MLKTNIDNDDDIGRYLLGMTETSIPVQGGNNDAPKNKINHKQMMNTIKLSTNVPMVANNPANNPVNKHIFRERTRCLLPVYPPTRSITHPPQSTPSVGPVPAHITNIVLTIERGVERTTNI